MTDHMGDSAQVPDEQTDNAAPGLDSDGWVLPKLPPPPRGNNCAAELRQHVKLRDALNAAGWHTNDWPTRYTRDGRYKVPDMVIWHPDLRTVGAVEVKKSIGEAREAADALRQCIGYTQCKLLATGRRIEWGAVYPFEPDAERPDLGWQMWGALNFSAVHFAVCAFIDEAAYLRWQVAADGRERRLYHKQRIRLQYTMQNRAWCSAEGFVTNAKTMLRREPDQIDV